MHTTRVADGFGCCCENSARYARRLIVFARRFLLVAALFGGQRRTGTQEMLQAVFRPLYAAHCLVANARPLRAALLCTAMATIDLRRRR